MSSTESTEEQNQANEAPPEAAAAATESEPAEAKASDEIQPQSQGDAAIRKAPKHILRELRELVDLSTKYPDIGPPLAQLAIKLGHRDIGEQVLRMGLQDEEARGVEFFFVAAQVARKEQRPEDVLKHVIEALDDFAANPPSHDLAHEDRNRLLHLIRLGFAALMFDLGSVDAKPEFTNALSEKLPGLESHYADDAFYHQLRAQALWFTDKEASEAAWEKAVEVGDAESVWNARGTWYKESSGDFSSAEAAYRKGIQQVSHSALLRHNLAQVLMDRAETEIESDSESASRMLNEAEGLLHNARRQAHRGRLRGHIHENLDRVKALKSKIPDLTKTPEEGDEVTGRVVSIKNYGAFLKLPGGETGLLHNSELAHEWVEDANNHVKMGDDIKVKVIKVEERDGDTRISLSRKALVPKPEGFDENKARPPRNDKRKSGGRKSGKKNSNKRKGRGNKGKSNQPRGHKEDSGFTMGELLLAKLEEQKKNN